MLLSINQEYIHVQDIFVLKASMLFINSEEPDRILDHKNSPLCFQKFDDDVRIAQEHTNSSD